MHQSVCYILRFLEIRVVVVAREARLLSIYLYYQFVGIESFMKQDVQEMHRCIFVVGIIHKMR